MKTKRFLLLYTMVFGALAAPVPTLAAAKKSFDIYSWPLEGNVNYCYAVLPSSKEARTADEIKASKDKVCGGRDDFKRIVVQAVPLNSKLYWKVDAANGMELPGRDIVNDFKRFSQTIPYKLVVEEPK